ncbi:hypothetical protein F4775DRAFT_596212 [Biscogniauxia sp. FL1348]|nr:hypothetical protein F4775DRAFT_596212 [Biscogniauxia sp. FL1348]
MATKQPLLVTTSAAPPEVAKNRHLRANRAFALAILLTLPPLHCTCLASTFINKRLHLSREEDMQFAKSRQASNAAAPGERWVRPARMTPEAKLV